MPLYEYQCDSCGVRFERIQKFSDPLATECPTCGGVVRKLISSPAIQFKGSGFYITDYAKPGSKGSDGEKSSKGESKGDSKPASSESGGGAASTSKTESSSSSTPAATDSGSKGSDKSSSSSTPSSSSTNSSTTK
jgi:putative FmdB family regulatory protein